jgi:hypothetical protein
MVLITMTFAAYAESTFGFTKGKRSGLVLIIVSSGTPRDSKRSLFLPTRRPQLKQALLAVAKLPAQHGHQVRVVSSSQLCSAMEAAASRLSQ